MFNLLAPLDYPRQAAANLVRGAGRFVDGEGTAQDALGMLPGAAGLLAAPLLSPLGGAALAGGLQGLGQLSGMEAFNAPDPSALVEALGGDPESSVQGMAAALDSDPMTYAGAASLPWWLRLKVNSRAAQAGGATGRAFATSQVERQAAAYAAEEAARRAAAPAESEILRALQADAALSAGMEGGGSAGLPTQPRPLRPLPADFNSAPAYGPAPGYMEWPGPIEARPRQGPVPPHTPLTGQLPPNLPMSLSPEQFELELDRMYRLAAEFEREGAPDLLRQAPERAMAIRAEMTNDILDAEGEFLRRAYFPGHAWMPPDLYEQVVQAGATRQGGNLVRDFSETVPGRFPEGSVPRQWTRGADANDMFVSRNFSPEQLAYIQQRAYDAVAERDLLPFLDLPGTEPRLMGPRLMGAIERPGELSQALRRNLSRTELPWQDPRAIPGAMAEGSSPGIGSLADMRDIPIADANRYYLEGIGSPVTTLMQPNNFTPDEVRHILARLENTGYPINRGKYADYYIPSKVSELDHSLRYPQVPIDWASGAPVNGFPGEGAPVEAILESILRYQLGQPLYAQMRGADLTAGLSRAAGGDVDPVLDIVRRVLRDQKF